MGSNQLGEHLYNALKSVDGDTADAQAIENHANAGAVNGSGVSLTEYGDGKFHCTEFTLADLAVAMADQAGVVAYGSHKLYDFPAGLIQVLGVVTDIALTKSSAGVDADWNGDVSIGTAAAAGDTTLDGAEADIVPSNATPEAVAGVSSADIATLAPTPVVCTVPLSDVKLPTLLEPAATAGSGVFGLVAGTHGSASATLIGEAASGGSKTSIGRFLYKLPDWYVAGSAITLRIAAKVATGLANTSDSLDVQVYKIDKAAGVGSDICATAAKTTLTTSYADYDFTITPTGLQAGDVLDVEITSVENDTGGTTGSVATISNIELRITNPLARVPVFDGTSTAKDLYINFLVDDADHDVTTTPCNLILNGTVKVYWLNLGDY